MLLPTSLFHLSDAFIEANGDESDLEKGSRELGGGRRHMSTPRPIRTASSRQSSSTTTRDGSDRTHGTDYYSTRASESTYASDSRNVPEVEKDANTTASHPPSLWGKLKTVIFPRSTFQNSPYRVLPIFSGIFIPFSVLLEIPSLTGHWYIRTVDNKTVEIRPNPKAMNIAMGFSMVCTVLATICLLIRFCERGVKRMTLTCIAFLTIHDIINIVTVTVFGVVHRFDDGFTYGQSFWMTTCSTIASFFTNITLLLDYIYTPDFEKKGSGLTRKQRSLAIVVILLLCFIAIGAFVHCKLIDLDFIDALYFTVVTIETIGFGDITPPTAGARLFTCSYAVLGILNLALAVGLIRDALLEAVQVGLHKRLQAMRARQRQRRVQDRWRQAIQWRLQSNGQPLWVKAERRTTSIKENESKLMKLVKDLEELLTSAWYRFTTSSKRLGKRRTYLRKQFRDPPGMRLNVGVLTQAQLEAAALEAGMPLAQLLPPRFRLPRSDTILSTDTRRTAGGTKNLTHARLGRMMAFARRAAFAVALGMTLPEEGSPGVPFFSSRTLTIEADTVVNAATTEGDSELAEIDRVQDEFEELIEDEEKRVFYAHLSLAWLVFIVFWMTGSAIFYTTEGWAFGTAMYFCFIAFSSLGYGDYSPKTPAGRSIFVVWALIGVGTLTILISIISEAYSARYKQVIRSAAFEESVQVYQEEEVFEETEQPQNGHRPPHLESVPEHGTFKDIKSPGVSSGCTTAVDLTSPISAQKRKAADALEALPDHILRYAHHMRTLMEMVESPEGAVEQERGLQDLLNDLPGAESLRRKANNSTLQDPDARRAMISLSLEKMITEITNLAEEAKEPL